MGTITAIEAPRGRHRQACIRLDDGRSLHLSPALVAEAGLAVGQALPAARAEALLQAEGLRRGLERAYRLLRYRPRSQAEVEERLRRAGVQPTIIPQVVQRLHEQGMLDDAAFARFWRQDREQFRPRGRRGLLWELKRLGVAPEVAREAVADLDETDSAYRAARALARRLSPEDAVAFRRRLGAGLHRRGFSGEVVRSVVERLWREATGQGLPEA